ncbi:MAG: SDR family oxidoreductase [Holosporales bacterium]|nr:SDR family oxidoreductase [Holosporales bacterium]
MEGKRGVIMGVTNESSIGWGIAKELKNHGAEIAFTFPNDAIKKRIDALSDSIQSDTIVAPCDVSKDGAIASTFQEIGAQWGTFDFVLHSIAFSDKNQLTGGYINTTRDNFLNTMLVSCFSFTEICREASKYMKNGGAILTLSYVGANRVIPHYNVMGVAKSALEASVRYLAADLGPSNIRVNAISAGAIRTAASSGIGDFHYIMNWNKNNSPLRRNVEQKEIGKSGLYMLSDLSSAVTGEVHYVDCGYNVVGMKAVDAPDIDVPR